ncbi:MAG TPA: TrmH family RNA methyltransferase, partial [Beutenbergiaceae bacterium]|nr:TrmH family RNA methyltransferase [Beutenbergiaceae bacterium]
MHIPGLSWCTIEDVFHVMFHEPLIPPNTGNAIRMVAATGAALHLIEPLGYELTDAHLRRAGLDYHDLSRVFLHPNLDVGLGFVAQHGTGRVFAFCGSATQSFAQVSYNPGDTLLFGKETTGLPHHVL